MTTLRELAHRCAEVEYIRQAGRYAIVRIPSPTGGAVLKVSRAQMERWMAEDDAHEQMAACP